MVTFLINYIFNKYYFLSIKKKFSKLFDENKKNKLASQALMLWYQLRLSFLVLMVYLTEIII